MKQQPCLLFYCQHSLGMGHLIRSLTLARQLSNSFRVVFLNGGRLPDAIPIPDSIELVDLPSLEMGADSQLVSRQGGASLMQIKNLRRQQILSVYDRIQPDVVLIELFPFGRKKFAFELLPLLRQASSSTPRPVVVCSVRDILVDQRRDQQRHDDRARWLVDRYFDAVLVHSDPVLSCLQESFRPRHVLKKQIYHTGFISADSSQTIPANSESRHRADIVVSAGGGIVGAPLFRCMIEAYPLILQNHDIQDDIQVSIVAGPFLPEAEWQYLQDQSRQLANLTVYRSVPDLRTVLRNARVSISQCGYNTAMDLLQTGIPSLVVPYSQARENEQLRRAEQLADLGVLMVLPEHQLNAQNLANKIIELLDFKPGINTLNLSGATITQAILEDLVKQSITENRHDSVA